MCSESSNKREHRGRENGLGQSAPRLLKLFQGGFSFNVCHTKRESVSLLCLNFITTNQQSYGKFLQLISYKTHFFGNWIFSFLRGVEYKINKAV